MAQPRLALGHCHELPAAARPPLALQAQDVVNGSQGAKKTSIAVLGASGYTGEEVVRLLALHPTFAVTVLTGETQAGKVRGSWTGE